VNSDSTVSPTNKEIFPGEVFVNTADFDTGIRRLLPKYDEMLDVLADCIANTNHRILELGCGTGELTLKVLQRYPSAEIVAVDYSPRMLDFARAKIESAGYAARWTGIEMDFGEWANNPNFSQGDTGTDPIIGQDKLRDYAFPNQYNNLPAGTTTQGFKPFVTMKGGEYFFAPSMSFLKNL